MKTLSLDNFSNYNKQVIDTTYKIPEGVWKLTKLERLGIYNNYIKELSFQIGSLTSLISLDISYNLLSDIPLSITNLNNLEFLTIGNNKLCNVSDSLSNWLYKYNSNWYGEQDCNWKKHGI